MEAINISTSPCKSTILVADDVILKLSIRSVVSRNTKNGLLGEGAQGGRKADKHLGKAFWQCSVILMVMSGFIIVFYQQMPAPEVGFVVS